ncbi:hypothetical protein DESUT3_07680 [Desulfuromonas versatilis]|uniref:Phosphonate transport system substrate-binding protein n=1 Tax=Desulfuromonas versatilis TaxID=2802975 RepID=A0ABM8HTA4_9BACT|nr:hypothetical protein DESUT3_07680 [Desulfuromonas versatilis]
MEKPVVHFGVIPRYNPMVMYRNYQPIMDYLSEHTPFRFELKLSRSYADAIRMLREGQTQVASLGDVTFAEAFREFGVIPLVKPLNNLGEAFYQSIIIVRQDSPIQTLEDLKGHTFAFGNIHSTSGNLIPRHYLFRRGISLFDLESFENLDTHDKVVKAVLKGKVAAGAVKDVVAYQYQFHGLRFLANIGPIPSVPIVVRHDTPPAVVEALRTALLAINRKSPEQIKEMRGWDPEFRNGFTEAQTSDYRIIFEMLDSIDEGCGARCH